MLQAICAQSNPHLASRSRSRYCTEQVHPALLWGDGARRTPHSNEGTGDFLQRWRGGRQAQAPLGIRGLPHGFYRGGALSGPGSDQTGASSTRLSAQAAAHQDPFRASQGWSLVESLVVFVLPLFLQAAGGKSSDGKGSALVRASTGTCASARLRQRPLVPVLRHGPPLVRPFPSQERKLITTDDKSAICIGSSADVERAAAAMASCQ